MAAAAVTLADCVEVLEARRRALCEAIGAFATPVAACDADYNALLAERAEVVGALSRLAPLARAEARIHHPRED
jgi:hypothetical protein